MPDSDPLPAHKRLAERCREQGLFTWHRNSAGSRTVEPQESESLSKWFQSAVVQQAVDRLASDHQSIHSIELFAGCDLIPIGDGSKSRRAGGRIVVMALRPEVFRADQFESICKSVKVNAEELRQELSTIVPRRHIDLRQLQQMLNWMYSDLLRIDRDQEALNGYSENLVQAYEQTHVLFRLARNLNSEQDPERLMSTICHQLYSVLPFKWVAAQFSNTRQVAEDLNSKLIIAGQLPVQPNLMKVATGKVVRRDGLDDWPHLLDVENHELAALVGSEVIAEPITHDRWTVGALLAGNKTGPDTEVTSVEIQFLNAAADFLGVFHENVARFAEQRALFLGIIHALTASVDAKDRYTCGHSERVALLGARLAEAMKMSKEQVEQYHIAGMLHDVGKIGVPEAVLSKSGRLSDEEFEQIKSHPVIGYNILKDIPPLLDVLPGVLHHHERWDGTGYPEELSGEHIPMMGRMLALADTFDAMSSTRSYRSAMARNEVLAEIRRCAGTQFDPELVQTFVDLNFSEYDQMVMHHQALSGFAA